MFLICESVWTSFSFVSLKCILQSSSDGVPKSGGEDTPQKSEDGSATPKGKVSHVLEFRKSG